jgi:hypothetical protein
MEGQHPRSCYRLRSEGERITFWKLQPSVRASRTTETFTSGAKLVHSYAHVQSREPCFLSNMTLRETAGPNEGHRFLAACVTIPDGEKRYMKTIARSKAFESVFCGGQVFFSRPWSITRTFTRFDDSKDRILPYTCTENNRDVDKLLPNQPNLDYKYVPEAK